MPFAISVPASSRQVEDSRRCCNCSDDDSAGPSATTSQPVRTPPSSIADRGPSLKNQIPTDAAQLKEEPVWCRHTHDAIWRRCQPHQPANFDGRFTTEICKDRNRRGGATPTRGLAPAPSRRDGALSESGAAHHH